MYAVIDVETTGASAKRGKITEIAIILTDGIQVEESYSTLINPECRIPHFISQLTGISNEMVLSAPKFFEVAKKIVTMTEGRIFVAHNAAFDYGFLRKEFGDLGFVFKRQTLCTVRLSRRLIPGMRSYSLGALCKSLDITNNARHRALGDAKATTQLLHHLVTIDPAVNSNVVAEEIQSKLLPPHFRKESLAQLPDSPGVYYFHDREGRVLYVGKSNNIRKRVHQHLRVDMNATKKAAFKNTVADVSFYLTGSDLISLLFESREIKRLRPPFNRALKKIIGPYALTHFTDASGLIHFLICRRELVGPSQTVLSEFSSIKAANREFERLSNLPELLKQCCHFYSSALPASLTAQITIRDRGLAAGRQELHQWRARETLLSYRFPSDNFLIQLPGRRQGESGLVVVQHGIYCGFGFAANEVLGQSETVMDFIECGAEQREARRFILNYFNESPNVTIFSLKHAEHEGQLHMPF